MQTNAFGWKAVCECTSAHFENSLRQRQLVGVSNFRSANFGSHVSAPR